MLRPSTHRTTATALGSHTVQVAAVGDLVAGDRVAVYGAGYAAPTEQPPMPSLSSGTGEPREYAFRYVYADKSSGPLTQSIATQADAHGHVTLEWTPGTLYPDAAWVLVYRSRDGGQTFGPIGATICHPRGAGILAGLRLALVDDGSDEYASRGLPAWLPASTEDGRRGCVRTEVLGAQGSVLTLADPIDASLSSGVLAHDAGWSIQAALTAGEDLDLGPGLYQCHGDLLVSLAQQHIRGKRPRRGELDDPRATDIRFEDGCGIRFDAQDVTVESLTLSTRVSRALPALDIVCPMRPSSGDDLWTQGVLALVLRRVELRRVSVLRGRGTGVAVIAGAGGIGNIASLCRIYDLECSQNTGHGLFVDGSDANAGLYAAVNVVGNGGWGVLDESLLGNRYDAPHASANALGGYRIDSSASRAVLSYAYVEGGIQKSSILGPGVIVIGGATGAPWTGQGTVIRGDRQTWLRVGRTHQTTIGHHIDAYDSYLARYDSPTHRHRRRAAGTHIDDYAGTESYVTSRWHGPHLRGYGLAEFPRGVLLDGVMLRAVDPASPPPGTYAPGDLCVDKTGGPARTPSEPFGIGVAWRSLWIYRVGDVVAPGDGHAYVCSATVSPFGSRGGSAEPVWASTVVDGDVTWTRWGPDSPRWAQ
jgi:hypothetical protein